MAKEQQTEEKPAADVETGRPAIPTVNWDDSNMRTSYANVVNAASTREEMTLFFGTNQTWNLAGQQEFKVALSDRIVLNPYAAKRLTRFTHYVSALISLSRTALHGDHCVVDVSLYLSDYNCYLVSRLC